MTNELIGSVLQVLAFSLIPFLVYLISKRKTGGFPAYIGLKGSTRKANLLAILASLIFLIPSIGMTYLSEDFKQILLDPNTMTGRFRSMGFGFESVTILLIAAVVKTSLSEEIFFRGFIAKRLISALGFKAGNILQAVIFGLIHLALFLALSKNPLFLTFIFLFPALGAWISAWLNERMAGGSIVPGWISHGLANIVSYAVLGFLV